MYGIKYSKERKCWLYLNYVTEINGEYIIAVSSHVRRLYFSKTTKQHIHECNKNPKDFIKLDTTAINMICPYQGDEIVILKKTQDMEENPELYFANIQERNPNLPINWPVRKGESKLEVHPIRNHYYLFYGNASDKAKDKNGEYIWGTREYCLFQMFRLNGWSIPDNLKEIHF